MRRLPILSRDTRLVGVGSLADLAVSSGNETQVGETFKEVAAPAEPWRSRGGRAR
jgi:hypothetical protein